MGKLKIRGEDLFDGRRKLGPASALYADSSEKIKGKGVRQRGHNPDRIDYLFCGRNPVSDKPFVVGLESKQIQDLISSWLSGRLSRQLAVLFERVDVQVLLIRGTETYHKLHEFPDLYKDLLKFQLMGGYIAFGPASNPYNTLTQMKRVFDGTANVRTVVERYEKKKVRGRSARKVSLQRCITGCGPKMAERLARAGSLYDLLGMDAQELRKAGANKTVIESLERMKK